MFDLVWVKALDEGGILEAQKEPVAACHAHKTTAVSMQPKGLRGTYRCTQLTPALCHLPIKEKEPRALEKREGPGEHDK